MFSNPATFANVPHAALWLNETLLVEALENTTWQLNYEFMRAELLESSGQLANMLAESRLGLAAGVHTYLNFNKTGKGEVEDPTPHVVAFQAWRASAGTC